MARIIQVPCTGQERHVNEIDLDDVLGPDVVLYGGPVVTGRDVPARIVRRCHICDEGTVIITREMIESSL